MSKKLCRLINLLRLVVVYILEITYCHVYIFHKAHITRLT